MGYVLQVERPWTASYTHVPVTLVTSDQPRSVATEKLA